MPHHTHPFNRRPAPPTQRAPQNGQVLIWFLAFAATLAVVFAGFYSVGQVTSEKQKVTNATDAAAYSGAMVEARALNLTAYTNRSVIANEVLIAQLVSLDSWTSYFEKATDNYYKEANALSNIPYVGIVFKALAITFQTINKIVSPLAKTVDQTVPVVITAWEALYAGWYNLTIAPAFIPPVMALAANNTANGVLAQNVATQGGRTDTAPRMLHGNAMMVRNQLEWSQLVKHYKASGTHGTSSDDRKYAAEILLASRDTFSTNRTGSDTFFLNTLFGNSEFCIPFVIKMGSEKQGPTDLKNFDRWEAQDTVEWKLKVGPTGCSWGKGTAAVPQGWGRATADRNGNTAGTRRDTSGGAGSLAYSANHANSGWTGVKELYDVDRGNNGRPRREELRLTVVAGKEANAVRTNEALGFENRPMTGPTGSPDLKAGFAKGQIATISEARVFFERPQRNARDITGGSLFRADNFKEYASMYNPYWQVRLVAPSSTTKALVYGLDGINPAISVFAQ